PFVVATCRETVLDKDFARFADAVTRQLLGTNADVSHLRELSLLPSYNKLGFIQKTVPTNYAARAASVREMHNETIRVFIATTGRSLHMCANCESADSYSLHPVRYIDNDYGDKICRRCEVYYKTYNEYPTPEELDRLAAFAENPPPPGVCQKDQCAMDGKSTWHWSFVHGFYLQR
ncbi:hypothetical protein D6C89_10841, partial [Aureobasidium pullulans]